MAGRFDSLITLENKDAVIAGLVSLGVEIQEGVIAELKKGGKDIVQGLKDAFPVSDTASLPGGIPSVQEGELKASIYSKIMPLMLGEPIALKIGSLKYAFYGHMLEFGTSKMAARPWFYTGILRLAPALKGQLANMLSEIIKRRNKLRPGQIRRGRMTATEAREFLERDIAKFEAFEGME